MIVGAFLYFNPLYTGSIIFSYFLVVFLLGIGIVGLGIELNRLGDGKVKLGFDDLGIGLGAGLIWLVIYYFLPLWWVNIINIVFLLIAVYGVTSGVIKILMNLFLSENRKQFLVKLPIVIFQFTAFIAAIATILNILKLI